MATTRKHSYKRDAILRCIRSTTTHPTAEWVYAQLKPDFPELSLGTVYRNLNLFKEEGEIISIGVVNGLERFDGNTEPHIHFVCTHCGAVYDAGKVSLPDAVFAQVQAETGGKIDSCELTFLGSCKHCRSGGTSPN